MSCDNIQGNGDMARRQFTAYAALRDPRGAERSRLEGDGRVTARADETDNRDDARSARAGGD